MFIGAQTDAEYKEKFFRVEDALGACRAAIRNGILPGGGAALGMIHKKMLSSDDVGYLAVKNSLSAPLERMWANAGEEVPDLPEYKKDHTYDLRTRQFGLCTELGVIDPFDVTKQALLSAGSAAGLLVTTACVLKVDRDAIRGLQ